MLRRLKDEGRAILYISHKLEEVKRLCDTATILRAGRKVATCDPRRETAASLARMMVGATSGRCGPSPAHDAGAARLRVDDLSLDPDDPHGTRLKSISLEVRGGEIVGIAGVAGNGQDELFAALSGERAAPRAPQYRHRRQGGRARIDHRAAPPRRRLRARRAARPRHRAAHDAVGERAADRACAAAWCGTAWSTGPATLAMVDRITAGFDVRKGRRDPEAASLSGGNLQKFVVGREILREPGVLVVSQPTWGVDAGAAAAIRQALIDLARRGSAVLVISQDLDELFEIADRIAVIYHGTLSAPLDAAAATREKLGLLMGGSSADDVAHGGGEPCTWS